MPTPFYSDTVYSLIGPLELTLTLTLTLVPRPISVQELIETAPGDIKCPSCSEPLTVDLSGDNDNSNSNSDGQGGPARAVTDNSGRRTGRGSRRGCGGSGGGTKDRVAKMVAKLEASVGRNKGAEKTTTTSPSVGVFGSKRFVTKHSVMNRIDLSKFQSVGGLGEDVVQTCLD